MICVPIIENNIKKELIISNKALKYADIVKFRLDFCENFNEKYVDIELKEKL